MTILFLKHSKANHFNIFQAIILISTFDPAILQAVHDGMDCKQYQQYMLADSQDENSKKTKEWIEVSIPSSTQSSLETILS